VAKRERTITELREKSKHQEQVVSLLAQVLLQRGATRLAGSIAQVYREHVGERLPRVPQSVVDDFLAERDGYLQH